MIKIENSNSDMTIALIFILTFELVIGVYLQVKKLKRVRQEKAFTWELEVYHSIVCIAFFSFSVLIEVLEQLIPVSCISTKWILCKSAWFIKTWGVSAIFLHSLSITMCKYIVIVLYKGMSSFRKNTQRLVISAIIAYPLAWTMLGLVSKGGIPVSHNDFVTSSISICNGFDFNQDYVELPVRSFFCGFNENGNQSSQSTFIFLTTEFFCFFQSLITLIVNMNVLEAFLYFKIFQSMNR